MEQRKIYKPSWFPIIIFILTGGGMILLYISIAWADILSNLVLSLLGLTMFSIIMGYGIDLLRKRREGKGFYWDNEGVVIDLKGNKVFWHEIENIKYYAYQGSKATVVYPHWRNHEKIAERHSRKMPTPGHSIDWFMVEHAKEMHEELMKAWEEKRPETKFFF